MGPLHHLDPKIPPGLRSDIFTNGRSKVLEILEDGASLEHLAHDSESLINEIVGVASKFE
jgi:hypothetical protein